MTGSPTPEPTLVPTYLPGKPTPIPSAAPTYIAGSPTPFPTSAPTYLLGKPTPEPTSVPSYLPGKPTPIPTAAPTYLAGSPTPEPTSVPTYLPGKPTPVPSAAPTYVLGSPTPEPTSVPTYLPGKPTPVPSAAPTYIAGSPTPFPTSVPTYLPGKPTPEPSQSPTYLPGRPTPVPTPAPTYAGVLNYDFEQDGLLNWGYRCPKLWSCVNGIVLIGYASGFEWSHTSNLNGGNVFVGIQAGPGNPSYIQQEIQLAPKISFSLSLDTSYRLGSCNPTLDVYCNVPGNVSVLSFKPTSTWTTTVSNPLCQTDEFGKVIIKFVNDKAPSDCTIFIDNIAITGNKLSTNKIITNPTSIIFNFSTRKPYASTDLHTWTSNANSNL